MHMRTRGTYKYIYICVIIVGFSSHGTTENRYICMNSNRSTGIIHNGMQILGVNKVRNIENMIQTLIFK